MMYVMCFFQVFEASTASPAASEKKADKVPPPPPRKKPEIKAKPNLKQTSSPQSPPSSSEKSSKSGQKQQSQQQKSKQQQPKRLPSNIPVRSKEFPKKLSDETKTTTTSYPDQSDSQQSSLDPEILDEYQSGIEDILTWLLGAEEQLTTDSGTDLKRFKATNFETEELLSGDSGAASFEPTTSSHNKIMAIIEAAEYAKMRFESHERFMSDLASYGQKVANMFEKGQKLIYSSKQRTTTTTETEFDVRSKREVALQMELLDNSFNQLRLNATKHQKYLQEMLIQTQNAQLAELRKLITQTEERIALLIPERINEMPSDVQSLEVQLEQFEYLQRTMASEQDLLKVISRFAYVDTDDTCNSNSNFYDQLEALNERWTNVCKITENRGVFLRKLHSGWTAFVQEEGHLSGWFGRLERRLGEIEDTIYELEESKGTTSNKFLQDLHRRLSRMRMDILYGVEHSQKLYQKQIGKEEDEEEDKEDDDLPMNTPLSKITQLSHRLLQLGESGLCSQVTKSLEKIRNRWETLIGRIEHSEQIVNGLLRSAGVGTEKQTVVESGKRKKSESEGDKRRKIDLCAVQEWQHHFDSFLQWIEKKEHDLSELSTSSDLFNLNEISDSKLVSFDSAASVNECIDAYQSLCKRQSSLLQHLLRQFFLENDSSFRNSRLLIESETDTFNQIQSDITNREADFENVITRGKQIVDTFKLGWFFFFFYFPKLTFLFLLILAKEDFETMEGILERLKTRWETLKAIADRCSFYLFIGSKLQLMKDESQQMRQILDKYESQLAKYSKHQPVDRIELENILQKIEVSFLNLENFHKFIQILRFSVFQNLHRGPIRQSETFQQ